ncbi:2OG-Fe(II) oxygenase [Microvirga alba]|uniref:2OG-Fe(II) oxygenase n=1 Tax=Microvirga alba TaxID=2791025 RepID=A0A931BKD7_9HYPH|nr:2OG-Fe(II) oxygenase [Microvirga alba]MBF9232846.1 2OG-Fe(II) oxygenase [Microvirga alba]
MTPEAAPRPFKTLLIGDPAPWFRQVCGGNPSYSFDTVAGRYLVLCFYGTASDGAGGAVQQLVQANRSLFDDDKIAFFGVSIDPGDLSEERVRDSIPGIRHFQDFDGKVSRLYGALAQDGAFDPQSPVAMRRFWVVLNPTMRVRAVFPFKQDGHEEVMAYLKNLPPVDRFAGFEIQAPVLIIPDVFEPTFCQHLISLYEQHGGEESGYMREIDGKTVPVHDFHYKRRKDFTITDDALIRQLQARVIRRINPEVQKIHFFKPTRMERYIVSCYAAEDGAHFRPHRDNTTMGTAHRRFAVSINLNGDFEGGEVSFPEYGSRGYKAPPGGAVVFSCSLLHAVSKVTSGRRFAFLPFIYDDEAARIRERNNAHLGEGVEAYQA